MNRAALILAVFFLSATTARADFYALLDYARAGNTWGVLSELARGPSPDRPEWEDGYTPLMFAASGGHAAMTRMLLTAGADAHARDHNGDRALLWAAQRGHPETVALLLTAGSPADSADDPYGETPLMEASRYGHVEVARLLLEAGADPNARDQVLDTALNNAVLAQSGALVALLLQAGADPNLADEVLLETPLLLAAGREDSAIVRRLIVAGARLEARNSDGQTPLWLAAARGQPANVAALLAAGANADVVINGETPLMAALSPVDPGYGDPKGAALLLVPETRDIDTALATAVWNGYPEIAWSLLERGASPDATDEFGRPALAGTVRLTGTTMFEGLIARGASIEQSGPAALLAAADAGRIDLAVRLLALGVPVDVRSERGATPLLFAAAAGRVLMVRLLLDHGADPAAFDAFGDGADEYMAIRPSLVQARIDFRQQSRAYRPTDDLEVELGDIRLRHAEIAALLAAQSQAVTK